MKKIIILLALFLISGCNRNAESSNDINMTINYMDFNELSKDNIHLKIHCDLDLKIFEVNTDGDFLYDITVGYKTYKFGELINDNAMIRTYSNNSEEEHYISFILEQDEEENDHWDVGVKVYSNSESRSIKSNVIMSEFGTVYKNKGNSIPHNTDVIPGKALSLINYHFTNKSSYSIEGLNGEINNNEEIDYIITWYVRIDNITPNRD